MTEATSIIKRTGSKKSTPYKRQKGYCKICGEYTDNLVFTDSEGHGQLCMECGRKYMD